MCGMAMHDHQIGPLVDLAAGLTETAQNVGVLDFIQTQVGEGKDFHHSMLVHQGSKER